MLKLWGNPEPSNTPSLILITVLRVQGLGLGPHVSQSEHEGTTIQPKPQPVTKFLDLGWLDPVFILAFKVHIRT